ncbi:MAG TPA: hypothetical protein VMF89_32930, partial [Polyangiales bacterium]|nr:hypothetical protein [Polyangiales bacterium]
VSLALSIVRATDQFTTFAVDPTDDASHHFADDPAVLYPANPGPYRSANSSSKLSALRSSSTSL